MSFSDDLSSIPTLHDGSVIAMGDFDGVHPGHLALIADTRARAQAAKLASVLVTYEPSPKKILKKLRHDSRLTTYAEKKKLLGASGLDLVIFYPVTAETLKISARSFLRNFLLERLRMRCLVMGADHHFGHNRRGNARYLNAAKDRYGFELHVVEEQVTLGERASSSRARAALAAGDVESAAGILGRPYSISGQVIRGEGRGQSLGFATANVGLDPEKLLPLTGVYSGTATLNDGQKIPAIANLGKKPTAGDFPIGLEVHLLDFTGNLYDQDLSFDFEHRIRGEQKFASLDALRAQIAADVAQARQRANRAKKVSFF